MARFSALCSPLCTSIEYNSCIIYSWLRFRCSAAGFSAAGLTDYGRGGWVRAQEYSFADETLSGAADVFCHAVFSRTAAIRRETARRALVDQSAPKTCCGLRIFRSCVLRDARPLTRTCGGSGGHKQFG